MAGKLINKTILTLSEAHVASQSTLSWINYTPLVISSDRINKLLTFLAN
jgi:hypothetical protein